MRMVIVGYSAGIRSEWFYYERTDSIYHTCSVQRKNDYEESDTILPCPYCQKVVPDFIILAAKLGINIGFP